MSSAVATEIKTIDNFIQGQYKAPKKGEYFEDIDPATGKVITKVANGGAEDIDEAAAAAKLAFEQGPWPRMSMQ